VQNTGFSLNKTLNIGGRLVDLRKPIVMGILNVTPDSFFDGGRYTSEKQILLRVEQMLQEGARMIDLGGASSRPRAPQISSQQEVERVMPALKAIRKEFPQLFISVDTFRSELARISVQEGADLINDISGGSLDEAMFTTIAELKVPYIMMHMKGNPQTMTQHAEYQNLIKEIIDYFQAKIDTLHQLGVKDIIIDPGFGFAKTREHNFQLLNRLDLLKILEKPTLVGLSRKSMIWKTLEISADDALNGTTVLNTIALIKGASILRVHDVKQAIETIQLIDALKLT
jgi:dihydropteroate synthase